MRTVTIRIEPDEVFLQRGQAAFRGEVQGEVISFSNVELLGRVLGGKRWGVLQAMTGQGAMSIREIARRVGRDVKAVHGDVRTLLAAGVLDRAESGGVVFPYDAVHVDFTLTKAA